MSKTIVNPHEHHGAIPVLEDAESNALFMSIGLGAVATDSKGNIARINRIALDILGFTHEEIIGKWYQGIIQAEDEVGNVLPNMKRPIAEVFMSGRPVSARIYYRKKNGERIALGINAAPILVDGEPRGAIEVFRDITEEVELEKAKDEFISVASHQLRTPATGVKQYAGMLLEGYAGKLTKQQQSMMQRVYDSNERQITIINDLLKVAHLDAGQVQLDKSAVDLTRLIGDIVQEQNQTFITRKQKVTYLHHDEKVTAWVDTKNIRMALENMIDNASKYTPEGKDITIYLKVIDKKVEIAIQDEGVGIAAADIPKLFVKFSRLENPLSLMVGGTGLGLYWSSKIITLHGGTINVDSRQGEGTTFIVNLPLGMPQKH